jgi:hypothetical protein
MSGKPEEKRESDAEYEAGDDGEVERGVFTAMDDVTREVAKAKGEFLAEVKKSAYDDEETAENEEGAAEFSEGIHAGDSRGRRETRQKVHPAFGLDIRMRGVIRSDKLSRT